MTFDKFNKKTELKIVRKGKDLGVVGFGKAKHFKKTKTVGEDFIKEYV